MKSLNPIVNRINPFTFLYSISKTLSDLLNTVLIVGTGTIAFHWWQVLSAFITTILITKKNHSYRYEENYGFHDEKHNSHQKIKNGIT